MRIAVVGGGIGGLCLAHGLRKAGVDVAVYERDRSRTDRLQGYRVHINPHGAAALRECLPAASWERFEHTAGRTGDDGFGFLTERLRPLLVLDPEVENHYSASRITLRQVLLDGLDVRFGKRFERYSEGDGITLHFEDGTTDSCDVLVGADGIRSRVRGQYLPHAGTEEVGVAAIAGKLFLDEHDWVPPALTVRANSIVPTGRAGMFLAVHDGLGVTDADGLLFDNERPYLMWAFAAADLTVHDGLDLRAEVLRRIARWSPELRRVVADSPRETISQWHVRSARVIDRWAPSRVTLLGDAIHAMTPMRGIGANVALRDAQLLARVLGEGGDPVEAIGRYEAEMHTYGFAAVRDSLRAARQFADGNPVVRTVFKTVLRTASALPALKRAMFAG
jgi:2-polyprenyl-6-methoxyphenol hydroxylase-like FAD-dependent oxidoreductase